MAEQLGGNVYRPDTEVSPDPGGGWVGNVMDGVQDSINTAVGAVTRHVNNSGPGYAYSREQMESLARKWEQLAEDFREDIRYAKIIAAAEGPGAEYASIGNAEMIRASGEALIETLTERAEYCKAQAAKFQAALGRYAAIEDDAEHTIKQHGGSL